MSKTQDLNVDLKVIDHQELAPVFPEDIDANDLLSFLKFSTELAADEVFWMLPTSEVIYANNAACRKLGYSREELIGMHVWEWDPLFPREVWPSFWEELKNKKHIDFDTHHHSKDGRIFPVRIKGHLVQQGKHELLFAFVSDLSEIKAQESRLRLQSDQLQLLVDTRSAELELEKEKFEQFVNLAPVGIAINRMEDGGFDYINNEFSRFTGYTVDELNSMDYWQLTPIQYEEQEQVQLKSMAETGRYGPYQKEYIHKEGHHYPVLLSGLKMTALDGKDYIWSVVQDISEQQKSEQKLRQAKAKTDSIALRMKLANDSAGIGVWEWDLETNALVWDEWMYKLYGVSENQFSGAYEAWENSVHPDDIESAKSQLEEAIAGSGTYEPEFRVVRPDGQVRTLKASAEVLRDQGGTAIKVVGVNYDVTDRIEALSDIANARDLADSIALRMKLANDSAGIGVWEWDLETNALVWDEWMYKLYGVSENQFSGAYEAWENSVHPDDIERTKSQLEDAIAGSGTYEPEFRVVRPDGQVRTLKASAEVLRDQGGTPIKVVGVNYDVTDRIEALQLLSLAKQDAEQAARAKSDFLANMSHEIRTPMNGVVGMLQILKRTKLDEEQHKELDIAISSAESLLVLINDILDFSKIEAGKLNIEFIEFDLKEQIEGVAKNLSHMINEDADVQLKVDLSQLGDMRVVGDPTRLRQIITNLLTNAIKFTAKGDVTIEASIEDISDSQFRLRCSVSDMGIGIAPDKLETLFEEFTQADSSTTRKYGGTGLGLSICKKLCQLMGGSISATSEEGKGSCFSFDIVLGKAAQIESPREIADSASGVSGDGSVDGKNFNKQRVLLVEDNKVNQLVAEHMLNQVGLSVDICANGLEALEALNEGAYSLILMDCQMPEMDGYEATERIRRGEVGEGYTNIPIIAMTANAMQGDKEYCIERGMNDYVSKPVEENTLRNTLAKWLN